MREKITESMFLIAWIVQMTPQTSMLLVSGSQMRTY